MTPAEKRTQVRMPVEVHQLLTERAKQNDRSMNAEIVRILRITLITGSDRGRLENNLDQVEMKI